MIRVSPLIAIAEMKSMKDIIEKWIQRVEEGIPTLSFEARDEDFELYMSQWVGELRMVAGKGDNLADVISNDR